MKITAPITGLLMYFFAIAASAQGLKCDICGQPVIGGSYTMEDRVTGTNKAVCPACHDLKSACFMCGLPVKEEFQKLPDGRFICARDARDVVSSEDEAREICVKARDDLDRLLSRFLTIPETNMEITIADRFQLENLFKAPGNADICVSYYGATTSTTFPGNKFSHQIRVLSHLKRSRLMAVCAHEFTHAWMCENIDRQRELRLDHDTIEGFCELVSYKFMESLQNTSEMQTIKKNNYTKGQTEVMIEADNRYGFNAVMEWMKSGEDDKLDMANLDRIRAVKEGRPATPTAETAALLIVPPSSPSPVPDTLKLKGISGSGRRRFALINDATLEALETGKVRVGQTCVTIHCLEIRDNSVVIQVAGSNQKQELFLRVKP